VSDGAMERVLKKFPVWVRPLVIEAVEGNWVSAQRMVIEQDKFLAARKGEKRTVFTSKS